MLWDPLFFHLALFGYLVGTLHYLLYIVSPRPAVGRVATSATVAGFAAQTISYVFRIYTLGRPPLGSVYESLSFLAWAIVLVYLFTEFRYGNRVIGAFVLPLVLLSGSVAAALPRRIADLAPRLQGVGLWVHVALAILGNAAFALTFCAGVMYLLQERQLKSRNLGWMHFRLPSLELLDDISVKSLLFGFPLLTLALITGSLWAEHARGSFLPLYGREIWSILSWLIFGGLLYARLSAGWRGKKAAILAIIGFCLVLTTLIGISVLRTGRPL